MKIRCSMLLAAFLTALAVFLGTFGKSEYKSMMRKKKLARQEKELRAKIVDSEELKV